MTAAAPLAALTTLLDDTRGVALPLDGELARVFGPMRFPAPAATPYVLSNFVSSLDGVVALGEPGTGGREISGDSREDRALMALLRAVADVVVVGAGTLRAFPRHVWTPEAIYAPLAAEYAELRRRLGKSRAPTGVVVSASGDVDPTLPVFTSGRAPAVVVTTSVGARKLPSDSLDVRVAGDGPTLDGASILRALSLAPGQTVLLECGPRLMSAFLAAGNVDELFLTVAPQIAGRNSAAARDGFVNGALFLPERPIWTTLRSVKTCGSVLFLRYRISPAE